MTTEQRKAHPPVIPIIFLVVLLLYVGTWPFIEFTFETTSGYSDVAWSQSYYDATGTIYRETLAPSWLVSIYSPLDHLRRLNQGRNAFAWYWERCRDLMHES